MEHKFGVWLVFLGGIWSAMVIILLIADLTMGYTSSHTVGTYNDMCMMIRQLMVVVLAIGVISGLIKFFIWRRKA
jgi:hypothetical protein